MTVINPNSISGITSITLPSGDGNVLTIHTNDGTERFRIDSSGNVKIGTAATISPDGDLFVTGVCTATTLSGAASGLTGALPAIDGSALTGIAATDNVRTGILDVAGIATFRNDVNIGAAVTISESGIEASGIGITCANINGTQIGGRRNLVINGDMRIAQRATTNNTAGASSTYKTLDRYMVQIQSGTLTESQQDLSSSDTPYTLGFRKYMRILNQSGIGAGAAQYAEIDQRIEAQDVAQSGWNYTSSSSYITLSFWVRASVAQAYVAVVYSNDGTQRHYPFEIKDSGGSTLSADTWTKITKTIPGDSGITVNNDNGNGLTLSFIATYGTNYTSDSGAFDAWNTTGGGTNRWPDMTTTWATTTNATFDITGIQLEVGSQATAFEHRGFGEELSLCQRYFQKFSGGTSDQYMFASKGNGSNSCDVGIPLNVPLRASPTLACAAHRYFNTSSGTYTGSTTAPTVIGFDATLHSPMLAINASGVTSYNNAVGNWCPYAEPLSIDSEL